MEYITFGYDKLFRMSSSSVSVNILMLKVSLCISDFANVQINPLMLLETGKLNTTNFRMPVRYIHGLLKTKTNVLRFRIKVAAIK